MTPGGHMTGDWRPNISSHLVMDGLTFTVKVLYQGLVIILMFWNLKWKRKKRYNTQGIGKRMILVCISFLIGHSCISWVLSNYHTIIFWWHHKSWKYKFNSYCSWKVQQRYLCCFILSESSRHVQGTFGLHLCASLVHLCN